MPSSSPAPASKTLSHEELLLQLETALKTDPTSETTRVFHAKALKLLDENKPVYNPFPEGTEIANLPQHVQDSWSHVQKLSPEKQAKISYYEKGGEWFINLDGTKISLQNESASSNPDNGINVEKGNTYFSQPAALAHATNKGRALPTNALWTQMANFLGGFKQLINVLQIPLTGWFHPGNGLQDFGSYAGVWSADHGDCLYVLAGDGPVGRTGDPSYGDGVRLLDA